MWMLLLHDHTYEIQDGLKKISCHIPVTLTHQQPGDFWPNIHCLCTGVSHTDVHYVRIFPKTYVCENKYSKLVANKSKNQNTLHVETDINLKLSTLQPDSQFLKAAEEKQPSQ
jgi:hypothetical protein